MPSTSTPGPAPSDDGSEARAHFRRTFVRVMAVQVVALLLLWWLQSRYTA